MSRTVYTLKKHKESQEMHLFEATPSQIGCVPNRTSICQQMNLTDSVENVFLCETEEDARKRCAELGRNVCAHCVSFLYSDYRK